MSLLYGRSNFKMAKHIHKNMEAIAGSIIRLAEEVAMDKNRNDTQIIRLKHNWSYCLNNIKWWGQGVLGVEGGGLV